MIKNLIYPLSLMVATIALFLGVIIAFKVKTPDRSQMAFCPKLISQNVNDYLGPNGVKPGEKGLVRVQVLVNDAPNPKGVQIISAEFNQKSISLKPRDIYGFRGQASFQVPQGKYKLKWKVKRGEEGWPRTETHEETVQVDDRDLWIQITIVGNSASIS